jgi:hypothetical protein
MGVFNNGISGGLRHPKAAPAAVDQVVGRRHAKRRIGALRHQVVLLDVEPEAADLRIGGGELAHVLVQPAVHASAPPRRDHEHALDPPEQAVTPVAPLLRHQQAGDDGVAFGGHHVEAQGRLADQAAHAGVDPFGQQRLALRLQRHRLVETRDGVGVGCRGLSDGNPLAVAVPAACLAVDHRSAPCAQ